MKYLSLALIAISLSVAIICVYFFKEGMTVEVKSDLDIRIGVDHKPAPEIHYHIKKEGTWGL
jgi:hypothetical protein